MICHKQSGARSVRVDSLIQWVFGTAARGDLMVYDGAGAGKAFSQADMSRTVRATAAARNGQSVRSSTLAIGSIIGGAPSTTLPHANSVVRVSSGDVDGPGDGDLRCLVVGASAGALVHDAGVGAAGVPGERRERQAVQLGKLEVTTAAGELLARLEVTKQAVRFEGLAELRRRLNPTDTRSRCSKTCAATTVSTLLEGKQTGWW